MNGEQLNVSLIERHYSYPLPNGRSGHYVRFRTFLPTLILQATPVSNGRDDYFSTAIHQGVSVVFSENDENGQRKFRLALSGGSQENRKGIISEFGSALTQIGEKNDWQGVSEPECQTSEKHIWRAEWMAKVG